MKKRIHIFIVLAMTAQILMAQQEYQLSHYGSPGTLYLYNRLPLTLPEGAFAENGENLTWDFSTFTGFTSHPTSIATPSSVIDLFTFQAMCSLGGHNLFECSAIWGSTDQALLSQDTISLLGLELRNLQRFHNKTQDYLLENFMGFNVDFGGVPMQAVVVYNSPDTVLHFPVTYQDTWESNFDWMIDLNSVGQNFRFVSSQKRISSVDAWGTLYTPFDTFTNVVRVRSEIHHTDTISMDTNSLPIDLIQLEYMWYDTAYKLPVMVASGLLVDSSEFINIVEYLFERTCPEPTWSVELDTNVFVLDETGQVTIDFNIVNGNADSYEWDLDNGVIETTTGNISQTYFEARDYAILVTGCMENCLPLNSCTFQIIEFTIEDISGVDVVDGYTLGITLHPNPAEDVIELEIPVELGGQLFEIIDMTGRSLQTGQLPAGHSKVELRSIPTGLYTIRFRNQEVGRHAILRFMVK